MYTKEIERFKREQSMEQYRKKEQNLHKKAKNTEKEIEELYKKIDQKEDELEVVYEALHMVAMRKAEIYYVDLIGGHQHEKSIQRGMRVRDIGYHNNRGR